MSITARPYGYPVGEIALATWFPKLDFLLAPEFTGTEIAVGFTRELARPSTASILLYPDSQNAYAGLSYEIEVSWIGSLVDYLVLSYSAEAAYSYAAAPFEYKVVGYSLELDYAQFANIKTKDPSVNFSYSVNYSLPHNVHSLTKHNKFTRTIEFDASKRAVDFTNDIRRHISYTVNG